MIKELTTYIGNNIAALTLGTNLYAEHLPTNAPDKCAMVMCSGGMADFATSCITGEDNNMVQGSFQVFTRATTPFQAKDLADDIFDLLHIESKRKQQTGLFRSLTEAEHKQQ